MHDTFLFKRISDSLNTLCKENRIGRLNKVCITTSRNSHICHDNLLAQLKECNDGLVGDWTELCIERQDIDSHTATIDHVEGESLE